MAGLQRHGVDPLKPLVVLGATGSIGRQTLEVAQRLGISVVGLAARRASKDLADLAQEWPDATVVATEPGDGANDLTAAVPGKLFFGKEALLSLAATPQSIVVNGVVGAEGLEPSVAAVREGNRLALANKESLVAGGPVLLDAAAHSGAEIVPVDSEHSAIYQCLVGEPAGSLARLVLTASGGPFRGARKEDLVDVGVAEALAHPTWQMGPRISIDSATMMNKALEVIEAHHLFGAAYDTIDVVVHPQSIVHSMVEMVDGSVKAQLGEPDMRVPIQYAITAPGRAPGGVPPLDLAGRSLTFERPDLNAFPCLQLGYEAGRRGGIAPAALNAADEVAVEAFLQGELRFLQIAEVVGAVLGKIGSDTPRSVADVLAADAEARVLARAEVSMLGRP